MAKRRVFICSVGSGLVCSAFAIRAQQPARIRRIGILSSQDGAPWDAFRSGLGELGYVEGKTIALEPRWVEGHTERFAEFAAQLVALKVDVIVAGSTQATQAAKQATASIPIVMATSAFPDKLGLVASLAHPGGNVTGLSNAGPDVQAKRAQLLKELAPKVSRVALLWNPASPAEGFLEIQAIYAALGAELQSLEVRAAEDYPAAFAAAVAGRADALHTIGNPISFRNLQIIVDFAQKNRLASCFDQRSFVEAGGLFSYAVSFLVSFRQAATYVDKILKGAKPADLPIQQPTKFELVLNAKTAKALGLTIPSSVVLRAEEIIG